jgi:flagellar biosynthesis protein FlhG
VTSPNPRVVSITSGKGGVGKTLTTVNLAIGARKMGLSVLILDGDLGLANVDVVLGLQPRYNIRDVVDGHVSLKDIIVEGPLGIKVIPSGSGISSLAHLSLVEKQLLVEQLGQLETQSDLLLIDTGAGISQNVLHLNSVADDVVIVTTPEPHAMTDAYAMIKVMAEEQERKTFSLLVNQTRAADEGLRVAERITDVAKKFLRAEVTYLGSVPSDPNVQRSIIQRRAASDQSTFTLAGQAWNQIARSLCHGSQRASKPRNGEELWKNLLWTDPTVSPRAAASSM